MPGTDEDFRARSEITSAFRNKKSAGAETHKQVPYRDSYFLTNEVEKYRVRRYTYELDRD